MASRKRSRDAEDVDGEEEVEIESASSSLQQASFPKRSRVALAQENGGSVVSDDDEDWDDDENSGEQPANAAHDSDSDVADDDVDELRATQIVQRQFKKHKDNIASDEGIIEEVFCRNFMCHSKLRIKLGPLINFVIGHNGSGKSAVLTALTMCLGGKATATNRGANLKSLIKEGEESAILAVKIKNQGDSAYKPELYGNSITVERFFSRAGTSGFKLKNAADKEISRKKADLDDILDYFAFQLDNPINVLTQDMARQFLSNSSPSEKYKLFIRGTQLEMLDQDYKVIEEYLDNVETKLRSRAEDIDTLRRKVEEAERRKKRLEKTGQLQDKVKSLRMMHAWAQVEEQEEALEKWTQSLEEARQKLEDRREETAQAEGAYEGHNQSFEAAQRALETFQQEVEPLREARDSEKDKLSTNTEDLKHIFADERTIRANMKASKADIKRFEADIKEEQDRLNGAGGTAHLERLERLEQLQEEAEHAKQEQIGHEIQITEVEQKRVTAEANHKRASEAYDQAKEARRQCEAALANAQPKQPRPFAGYRENMVDLVKAIDNETRWRSKPVGPMGRHIKLLKPEWSSQIEKTFGGVLESFVVSCKEDQNLLSQMMKRLNCLSNVFIGNPTPLNTIGKEPDDNVETILRVLDIDSHPVRNQLIINQAIDQTVLIGDREEANAYMNAAQRPRNVRATICFATHRRGAGIRFEFSRSGFPKSSPIDPWAGQPRMETNREDRLTSLRENLAQVKKEEHAAEAHHRQLRNEAEQAKKEKVAFGKRQQNLKIKVQQAEDAVQEMQNEIESNRPQDGKLQELERQLAEARDELESHENSYQDMVVSKDKHNDIARELKSAMDTAQSAVDQAEKKILRAEQQVDTAQTARQEALHAKNHAFEMIEEAVQQQARIETRRDDQANTVREFTEQASATFPRVPVERGVTLAVLDERIKRFSEDIQRLHREVGGTPEELTLAYHNAKLEFDEAETQLRSMTEFAETLKATLKDRHFRWEKFRSNIAKRARINFAYLLSERRFRGRVLMDHRGKELDIRVEPDLTKASDAGRVTKTLSGGEKSFSTICLLLSIWDAMGSPIRCLDEFDVFMDSANRATSMTMMIKAARRSVGRQFILITPQSMNNVEMGDDVKVHKMSDPERGQTSLPY